MYPGEYDGMFLSPICWNITGSWGEIRFRAESRISIESPFHLEAGIMSRNIRFPFGAR